MRILMRRCSCQARRTSMCQSPGCSKAQSPVHCASLPGFCTTFWSFTAFPLQFPMQKHELPQSVADKLTTDQ